MITTVKNQIQPILDPLVQAIPEDLRNIDRVQFIMNCVKELSKEE